MHPQAIRWFDAIKANDLDFVRTAIARKRAIFAHEDRYRNGVLHWAASVEGGDQVLALLLAAPREEHQRHQIDRLNNHNLSPLGMAVEKNQVAQAQLLLDAGADPNKQHTLMGRNNGPTALHNAHGAAVARLLIQAGADLERRDVSMLTPLLHLAMRGQIVALDEVLAAGGDPMVTVLDNPSRVSALHGCNALHLAALQADNGAVLKRLLQVGVPLHAVDARGRTPLDHAREAGRGENLATLERWVLHEGMTVPAVDRPVAVRTSRPRL